MKNYFIYSCVALMLLACKPKESEKEVKTDASTPTTSVGITADPMPAKLISGQKFPTPAATINKWVKNSNVINNLETNEDIITHGWDLWDALTTYTNQKNNDQNLRRFETWYTPADIQSAMRSQTLNSEYKLEDLDRSHSGHLTPPHQSAHGINVESSDVVGFVKCDPTSANHIFNNELYYFEVLKAMIVNGEIANIPAFPASSVLIKPVFQALAKADPSNPNQYKLPVWPGYHDQVPMDSVLANGFGSSSWKNDIMITTTGATNAANKVYSINDFINFKLTKEQAANVGNFIMGGTAKEGDYAVLVAMHVNTRENRRWTWQTFWWSENATSPQSPSSSLIASLQPKGLEKAAQHYAMAAAYSMIGPAQPNTGGSNALTITEPIKESIYAYNPYLEAGFNVATFEDAGTPIDSTNSGGNPSVRAYYPEGYQNVGAVKLSDNVYEGGKLNRVGIETNCMSCHSQARVYNVSDINDAYQYYLTDQYVDLDAPYFNSSVALDFAWSIQGSLISKD